MAKGSNHSFKSPKQTVHQMPKKDHMADNVGGRAHMNEGAKPAKPFKGVAFSGGGNGSGKGKHKS